MRKNTDTAVPTDPSVSDARPGSEWTPSVFLSYRRDDTGDVVEPLADRLKQDLHHRLIFRDADDLNARDDFGAVLDDEVRRRNTVLFFIGDRWASGQRADGTRYDLADEQDWVRREIRMALTSRGSAMPVRVGRNGEIPQIPELPADVAGLIPSTEHVVDIRAEDVDDPTGKSYRRVLGAIWAGAKEQIDGGVLIVSDIGTQIDLDAFVQELKQGSSISPSEMVMIAANVGVLRPRSEQIGRFRRRRMVREWPDALIVTRDGELTEYLRDMKAILEDHPAIKRVAVVSTAPVAVAAFTAALPSSVHGGGLAIPAAVAGMAVVTAGAVAWVALPDPPVALAFAPTTELDGINPGSDGSDFYFADSPPSMTVELSDGQPVVVESEVFDQYRRHDVAVEIDGIGTIEVGRIELPTHAQRQLFEQNGNGTYRLASVSTDISGLITEIPVENFCYRIPNRDDRIGGFRFDGTDGELSVSFSFTIDGDEISSTAVQVFVEGWAVVELTEPITDDMDVSACRDGTAVSTWGTSE